MNTEEKKYQIALLEIDGIGPIVANQLLDCFGTAEEIFRQSDKTLRTLNKAGASIIDARKNKQIFQIAENEINYCEKHAIQIICSNESNYPQRLKHCPDNPTVVYYKGTTDLNSVKVVSIVGTRNATTYGKKICEKIIEELSLYDAKIISGLAYGIDIHAHLTAINNKLETVGVLAHGLDRVYPKSHSDIAHQMMEMGGLLTEHKVSTNPDRENFPKRNRIVAGLSDATIVIESAIRGGSMITANLANSYNRDVFAVPGQIGSIQSEGCNHLIKINKAQLIQSVKDISYILGWDNIKTNPVSIQKQIFVELSLQEQKILETIKNSDNISIDSIAVNNNLPISKVSSQLLLLEFKGLIKQIPGMKYTIA